MRHEGNTTIYTQEVCINGHQITDHSESEIDPTPPKYCEECGEKVIRQCQNCKKSIDGYVDVPGIVDLNSYIVPNFCKYCGNPYPWTESIIENAAELVALDVELTDEDKALIKSSIPDLLVDTPKTQVAAAKYRKVVGKAAKFVKDGLYNLLVDVVSETAKKTIFPS